MQDTVVNPDSEKPKIILPPSKVNRNIKTANIMGTGVGLGLGLSKLVNIYKLAKE